MTKMIVVKIGGNVLDDHESLSLFLNDFASIQQPKILIHGGGKTASRIGEQLKIKPNFINGRRITDIDTLNLVSMVYAGLINKQLVARLQQLSCNAIGLTGADGNLIKATKRQNKEIDFGFVGDIYDSSVNSDLLHLLISQKLVPVFAALTHGNGTMLNTNADTIASTLAIAMSKYFELRLIFCFDKKGVLLDVEDPQSQIHNLNESDYRKLLTSEKLHDGILPKLENAFLSLNKGIKEIIIGEAKDLLVNITNQPTGTWIKKY